MTDSGGNLTLYRTPTSEILRHRKEFYGALQGNEEKTSEWLNRIQRQLDRCEFPKFINAEYLLIDKFVCELSDDEREAIGTVNIWTLMELNEYVVNRNGSIDNVAVSATVDIPIRQHQRPSSLSLASMVAVKCEFVSNREQSNQCVSAQVLNFQ